MKDQLENFIQENRDSFEMHEPNPALWDKIVKVPKRSSIIPQWSKYAITAMVIFALGFGFGQFSDRERGLSSFEYEPGQVKIIESEYYYQTQINEQMQELQPYFAEEPRLRFDIESDFEELDAFCKELKEDLADNINNEHVIEALIKSYKTKLDILEALHQQLIQECHEEAEVNI